MDAWGCHGLQVLLGDQVLRTLPPSETPPGDLRVCAAVRWEETLGSFAAPTLVFEWDPHGGAGPLAVVWGSDGTVAGTRPLLTVQGGCRGCENWSLPDIHDIGGRLYLAQTSDHGGRILVTQGTKDTTEFLGGLNAGAGYRADGYQFPVFQAAIKFGSSYDYRLLYAACGGPRCPTGRELWVSDGTRAGSHLLMDIRPGPKSSKIMDLCTLPTNGNWPVSFTADDGHGRVRWVTDGTVAGTHKSPGPVKRCGGDDDPYLF
jgi:ELWxxDGT repeat protein